MKLSIVFTLVQVEFAQEEAYINPWSCIQKTKMETKDKHPRRKLYKGMERQALSERDIFGEFIWGR